MSEALDILERTLVDLDRVIVAFSGGADSAFLAKVATDLLGKDRVLCATAISASLASAEREECSELAQAWDLRWLGVETSELEDVMYQANGPDRCARCKLALMDVLAPLAAQERATVILGVNVDDLGDHRPGQAAALEQGARFPMVEAGLTKAAIRQLSKERGLSTWDKPAAACLASRIPYGTKVTVTILSQVERAEAAVRRLGFKEFRVRHHGDVARLEMSADEQNRAHELRAELSDALRGAGYLFAAIDLDGFSSGSLNRALGTAVSTH